MKSVDEDAEPPGSRRRTPVILADGFIAFEEEEAADGADASAADVAPEIVRAFAKGPAAGILHLALFAGSTPDSAALGHLRDLGRLFMQKVCALPAIDVTDSPIDARLENSDVVAWLAGMPPMPGAENATAEVVEAWRLGMVAALTEHLSTFDGKLDAFLAAKSPSWHVVGRVCLHLAENKKNTLVPFAFLATQASTLSRGGTVQHVALGEAIRKASTTADKKALLNLLMPLRLAAESSPLIRRLVDSGAISSPQAWTPEDAYRFLQEIPLLESSGVVVRVPDWWKARRTSRPVVTVTVGSTTPSQFTKESILDFNLALTLDGETLTPEEMAALRKGSGLMSLKGRWVEVDRDRLDEVLKHWTSVEKQAKQGGLSFFEGMRLLAGAPLTGADDARPDDLPEWSRVVAGKEIERVLAELRAPESKLDLDLGDLLKAELRPYQRVGLQWLWRATRLGLGVCLADDMGLGKTIQVIALWLAAKKAGAKGPHLLVAPASLVANWKAEIDRFAPSLRYLIAHPSFTARDILQSLTPKDVGRYDAVITTYGSLERLPFVAKTPFDLVVLDEAQAIKNPGTRQTRAAKALPSRVRVALTGTPVENRLGDLWSLFDFLAPGLLGSAKAFTTYTKRLEKSSLPNCFEPLRRLVRPFILRRMKTDRTIISDLPEKTEMRAYCGLTKRQAALYQAAIEDFENGLEALDGMARRGAILALLMRLKQICNHPSQVAGDGVYAPEDSAKFARLAEIAEAIAARHERVLVFTQFREITEPIDRFLSGVFRRTGLCLHGGTPVAKRRALVERFQEPGGPPYFVLSVKAGGSGLNLTAASHVVHFDRWWNPAVEEQATDRAFRIGQKKNVLVHKFVCRGTIEERVDALIESKRQLTASVIGDGAEAILTELDDKEILQLVRLDLAAATQGA